MRDALVVLLLPLAAYFISWVIVHSKIALPFVMRWQLFWERRWERRHPEGGDTDEWQSRLAYLPSCIWCTGFWISGMVITATGFFISVPLWGLVWLYMAALIGIIDSLTHRDA